MEACTGSQADRRQIVRGILFIHLDRSFNVHFVTQDDLVEQFTPFHLDLTDLATYHHPRISTAACTIGTFVSFAFGTISYVHYRTRCIKVNQSNRWSLQLRTAGLWWNIVAAPRFVTWRLFICLIEIAETCAIEDLGWLRDWRTTLVKTKIGTSRSMSKLASMLASFQGSK